jgi:type IV pilus assembly protein PilX
MRKIGSGERGAALIVSLIVLLVLTLIGVAGMNSSILQERMAVNAQNMNRAFQAAESSVSTLNNELAADNLDMLRQSMQNADNLSDLTVVANFDPDNNVSGEYQARFLGEVIVTSGSSMDANESSVDLKGYRYELTGHGEMADTGAEVRVFKGIEYY